MNVEFATADLLEILEDVDLFDRCLLEVVLLDREQTLVLGQFRLVLLSEGKEEVIQEVVPDFLFLFLDDVVLHLLFQGTLCIYHWAILLLVVLFQLLLLICIQHIVSSGTEPNLIKTCLPFFLINQLAQNVVELE